MEAINPGHANRLLTYTEDPYNHAEATVSRELRKWYDQDVGEVLAAPITHEEVADVDLFFSSLDDSELLALYGAWHAGRWSQDPETLAFRELIDRALPSVSAAGSDYELNEQNVANNPNLALILKPGRAFIRSVTERTSENAISKGAIHARPIIDYTDTTFELQEVHPASLALLATHEVLIQRLHISDKARHTALPLEYSRTHRWLTEQDRTFTDIDAARRYVGNIALYGFALPNMNEPYQQGLLSLLQNCSLFPDVMNSFLAGDRDGFVAMQEKIAQIWPTPGRHGAFSQCGFMFDSGLLHYDGQDVHVAKKLQDALAELPQNNGKLDLTKDLEVPLYTGRRTTVSFKPTDLPDSLEDDRPIKGQLQVHSYGSPHEDRVFPRCPALTQGQKTKGKPSVLVAMAALLYDHAKMVESAHVDKLAVTELSDEWLFKLTDTPQFRQNIPADERATWIDPESGTDLIETGEFRSPELRATYTVETVMPMLPVLGREAIKHALTNGRIVVEL